MVLIAAALKVPTEVFRKAFSGVTPAAGGQEPEAGQVHRNKETLLCVPAPTASPTTNLTRSPTITDTAAAKERCGEMSPAAATAIIHDGVVTGFTITNAGSANSSPPGISIAGMDDPNAKVKLHFGTDFRTNGSIQEITLGDPAERTSVR